MMQEEVTRLLSRLIPWTVMNWRNI
jgi:hypothetical protein